MRAAFLILLVGAACSGTNPGVATNAPTLDEADYTTYVHPILEARCGTLDCHGAPGRPLRLFAETGLRATDALRGQPITAAELAANLASIAAVDPGAPLASTLLLSKPVAGGVAHAGGDVWPNTTDPQPACFAGWLAGALPVADCQLADQQTALPPPN